MSTEQKPELKQGYKVEVDDNFHFMDEDERWCLGEFATYEEALAAAKRMVEEFFGDDIVGETAEELFEGYTMMGDDPFIVPFAGASVPKSHFSAWDYAKEYAEHLVAKQTNRGNPANGGEK